MKKYIVVALMVISLAISGCDNPEKPDSYDSVCLNGVMYYYFYEIVGYSGFHSLAPAYNQNGSLVLCDN